MGIGEFEFNYLLKKCKEHCPARYISKMHLILMTTLTHFKHYTTIYYLSCFIHRSFSTTFRWIKIGIEILYHLSVNDIKFPSNLMKTKKNSTLIFDKKIVLILDGKEQAISTPSDSNYENETYSGKYKSHTLNLIVGCDPINYKVLFVSRSYQGSKTDQVIFDSLDWKIILNDDEYILTDKGFNGEFVISKKNYHEIFDPSNNYELITKIIDKKRIVIENIFAVASRFAICSNRIKMKMYCLEDYTLLHHKIWMIVFFLYNSFFKIRNT